MRLASPEWFDIVDEEDRVVGRATRQVVHRQHHLHRAVHVFIFNKAGDLFLQLRSMSKDMHPGKWDSSASGHLDSGEDYDTAAYRECGEELGWHPRKLEKVLKLDACGETGHEFVWLYRTTGEGPFVLHPEEISDGRWFTMEELELALWDETESFSPCFRYIWQKYLDANRIPATL